MNEKYRERIKGYCALFGLSIESLDPDTLSQIEAIFREEDEALEGQRVQRKKYDDALKRLDVELEEKIQKDQEELDALLTEAKQLLKR